MSEPREKITCPFCGNTTAWTSFLVAEHPRDLSCATCGVNVNIAHARLAVKHAALVAAMEQAWRDSGFCESAADLADLFEKLHDKLEDQ